MFSRLLKSFIIQRESNRIINEDRQISRWRAKSRNSAKFNEICAKILLTFSNNMYHD